VPKKTQASERPKQNDLRSKRHPNYPLSISNHQSLQVSITLGIYNIIICVLPDLASPQLRCGLFWRVLINKIKKQNTRYQNSCLRYRAFCDIILSLMFAFARSLARFSKSSSSSSSSSLFTYSLRIHGPDSKGIVASCSNILDQRGYEIVATEHWTDRSSSSSSNENDDDLLFLRIAFFDQEKSKNSIIGTTNTTTTTRSTSSSSSSSHQLCSNSSSSTEKDLQRYCAEKGLSWTLNWRRTKPRVSILVSKYDHCLWELLLRHEAQELECDIVAVMSNHENLRHVAETFGIPFHFFPMTTRNDKKEQERRQVQLLKDELNVDTVVLARYMQVLTKTFLDAFPHAIINIQYVILFDRCS
jgi:formyltetrahydrofolate hydrolase